MFPELTDVQVEEVAAAVRAVARLAIEEQAVE
jgi:hypothetical protein